MLSEDVRCCVQESHVFLAEMFLGRSGVEILSLFRYQFSNMSLSSSNSSIVSVGLAIQAVVPTTLALKSLLPALRNWSPT